MKTTFYMLVIVIVSYILLVFISPSVADNIGDKLGIKDTNEQIRNFKSGLDIFSTNTSTWTSVENSWTSATNTGTWVNPLEQVTDLQWWVMQARDIITNKISETKTDLDDTRKAVDETNKNIQKTQDSINATLDSVNQVQTSLWKIVK